MLRSLLVALNTFRRTSELAMGGQAAAALLPRRDRDPTLQRPLANPLGNGANSVGNGGNSIGNGGGRVHPSVGKLLVGGGISRLPAVVAAISVVLYWQFVYLFYLDRRIANLLLRLILQPVRKKKEEKRKRGKEEKKKKKKKPEYNHDDNHRLPFSC